MTMTEPLANGGFSAEVFDGTSQSGTDESTPFTSVREVNKSAAPSDSTVSDDNLVDKVGNIGPDESKTVPENETASNLTENESASKPKKIKKNVSFPDGSTIVKGYLPPPDPWKNAPPWNTADLVQAYKKACEQHGTKPLSKVTQQLQGIDNVGERYEILSLKGEKLDMKHCESLEEIFKRVRFRCIDLEATHLDDETSVSIFDMVEYYESACKLNISFNKNIGPRGWQSCARLVRKTPCLTWIDARNCDLNERVIPILGRSLRMGCYLTKLHLQNTGLAARPLIILVAALKMNETMKELFLGDNKMMPTDGIQIGNLLKYNHKLELLDVRNNHLQDVGTSHICEGLREQNLGAGLITLVLWNNQITFQAMPAIAKALEATESLETLNLGHNPITNEGIHLVKEGLLKSKSVLKLGLSGTKVTCEGAVALAEVIADNPRLTRIDLQENDIKTAGLMALSLALKVSETITRLDLDKDTKKESGVKDYAEQQKRLQQDILNILERNRDLLRQRTLEKSKQEVTSQNVVKQDNQVTVSNIPEEEGQEEESTYIPSVDNIQRPKLLVLPHYSPEQELDSPEIYDEAVDQPCPPLLSPTGGMDGFQDPAPTGIQLLSPQYCPSVKAKKLFSVTKVLSPCSNISPSSQQSLCLPHIYPPLSSVSIPSSSTLTTDQNHLEIDASGNVISPSLVKESIASETIQSYIQQIVDDADAEDQSADHVTVMSARGETTFVVTPDKLSSNFSAQNSEFDENSNVSESAANNVSDSQKMDGQDSKQKPNIDTADGSSIVYEDKQIYLDINEALKETSRPVIRSLRSKSYKIATRKGRSEDELMEEDKSVKNVGDADSVKRTSEVSIEGDHDTRTDVRTENDVEMVDVISSAPENSGVENTECKSGGEILSGAEICDSGQDSEESQSNSLKSNVTVNELLEVSTSCNSKEDSPMEVLAYSADTHIRTDSENMQIEKGNSGMGTLSSSEDINGNMQSDNPVDWDHAIEDFEPLNELHEGNNCEESKSELRCSSTGNRTVEIDSSKEDAHSNISLDSIEIVTLPENNAHSSSAKVSERVSLPVQPCDSAEYHGQTCDTKFAKNPEKSGNPVRFSSIEGKNVEEHKRDSGIGSYDLDQWNTVESSEVSEERTGGEILSSQGLGSLESEKPNFHTSLSMNGLKQELASLIDGAEQEAGGDNSQQGGAKYNSQNDTEKTVACVTDEGSSTVSG